MAILLIGTGCTAHRASIQEQPVTLHGFFDGASVTQVKAFLLDPPLPSSWVREVPLDGYPLPHKTLYTDCNRGCDCGLEKCDNTATYGLESSTLAFYVGHGGPNDWTTPDDPVPVAQVKVGDALLRYFWLYSCNVLAHGPEVNGDFPLPHLFQSKRDHADVFQRWNKLKDNNDNDDDNETAFGPHLRMVCSGSSKLGTADIIQIWNNLLDDDMSVPDAFVLGAARLDLNQVPVCLARGGESPVSSALSDVTLHTEGVTHDGPNWLHLQMPVTCTVERNGSKVYVRCGEPPTSPATSDEPSAPAIDTLPVVTTTALSPPVSPVGDRLPLGFKQLSEDTKYHPDSGAIVLIKSGDLYSPLSQCDHVTTWAVDPWELLAQSHLDSGLLPSFSPDAPGLRQFSDVTALEMRVESRQDRAPVKDRKCWLRSLFLRFDTKVKIGAQSLPIFGPGITFEVQHRAPGGAPGLASFSAPNRALRVSTEQVRIKPVETAKEKAHLELKLDPDIYPVGKAEAILGYEEAPLHCKQEFLRPTYEIRFFPEPEAASDHPTVIVRRDARVYASEASWKCQGWDDSEERSLPQP